jgi:hypothetical protein
VGLSQAEVATNMGTKGLAVTRLDTSLSGSKHSPTLATLKNYAKAAVAGWKSVWCQCEQLMDRLPSTYPPSSHGYLPWRVVEVHPLPEFRLRVRFVDGLEGTVDMAAPNHASSAGVLAQYHDRPRLSATNRWRTVGPKLRQLPTGPL